MRYKIDHDYHIHSYLSPCAPDPNQTAQRILQYAKENGLRSICVTDHYWDAAVPCPNSSWYPKQNFDLISQIKPLPQEDGIEFLFGCEGEQGRECEISVPPQRYDDFGFIVIPTTHLHMRCTSTPEEKDTNEKRARLWVRRLEGLLRQALPFRKMGIAHLACGLLNSNSRQDCLDVLDKIPSEEMERLFSMAASRGCGIELNLDDMSYKDSESDTVLRMFRIAKSCGCKFYLGSDAHTPEGFLRMQEVFSRAISALALQESDKFHIG